MGDWNGIAPGVHQYRSAPSDLSVVVIEGADELLVVDTGADPVEGEAILAEIRSRFGRPPSRVVNTHAHFDHTFGNQVFAPGSESDAAIHGHAGVGRHFERYEAPRLAAWLEDPSREPGRRWDDVRLTPPTNPVDRTSRLDLGGRSIELRPQPAAHTDTDLVVFLPAERVWIVGDLIEQSGPPMYGSGSYPLSWPAVLDALADEMLPGDAVVPGHGRVVDRAFVRRQAVDLRVVADRILEAHARGLDAAAALAAHDHWPVPVDGLTGAVERGYAALDGAVRDGDGED
jgi:glyoxylase-like metal-dependent hydrolase (beta-lactamase superfamily II)